ncbi:MAG: MliC family protein [Moraxella sp.]|uniref:MliC family protein n=1 Tax=Moraxella sp. TaxID=479 RepID=UPI0026DD3EDE|nr:MliC family protein [Moraxella sp.]MDO4450898.1 MliC family protein [Moraxella sp.]
MKKLLIATSIISALVMTGCASTTSNTAESATKHPKEMHHKHGEKHGEKHSKKPKHPHGEMVEKYTCEQDASVIAKYNPDTETALLDITAPSLSLSNAEVEAKIAPSASGMRFVNDVNPASKYEWHAKGNIAVLDVTTANGQTYSINCEGSRPMHNRRPK